MILGFIGWAVLALGGVSLIGWLSMTGKLDGPTVPTTDHEETRFSEPVS